MTIDEFRRRIKRERARLKAELISFHRAAAIVARDEREKGFMDSTGPDGIRWKPLSPSTIRQKSGEHSTTRVYRAKKGGPSGLATRKAKKSATPDKPLIDTGAMMKPTVSATAKSGKVTMARSRGEVVSSAGSIAMIHDKVGVKSKSGRIVRHHWGIYPNAVKQIEKAWNEKLKTLVVKLSR